MPAIGKCPIRAQLVKECFWPVAESDALWLIAALYLYRMRVTDRLIDKLLRPDYPLHAIALIFEGPGAYKDSHIAETRADKYLPGIPHLATAAATIAEMWDDDRVRGNLAYWCQKWNAEWKHFGLLETLPLDVRARLSQIADRLKEHPDVLDVYPKPNNEWCDHPLLVIHGCGFHDCTGYWCEAVLDLPLRGILAFALLNFCSVLPEFQEHCRRASADDYFDRVLSLSNQIRAFVESDACDSEAFVMLTNLRIDSVPKSLFIIPRSEKFSTSWVLDSTLSCARLCGRQLLQGDVLQAFVERAAQSTMGVNPDYFFGLLQQDLGVFPELGRRVDLSAFPVVSNLES